MEKWKPIPGYRGYYEASTRGRIRSLSHYRKGRNGHLQLHRGKIRRQGTMPNGYRNVTLSRRGVTKTHYVHRLIWVTFKGPLRKGLEINHKDTNKANNRLRNLEPLTRKGNMRHALEKGLTQIGKVGEDNPAARLTNAQARRIRKSEKGLSELARRYGTTPGNIWLIKTGKTFKGI